MSLQLSWTKRAATLPNLIFIMTSIQKGTLTELQCQYDFTRLGYLVSQPISPCRYDFIVDIGTSLIRIQCKTARLENNGTIRFECRSGRGVKDGFLHERYSKEQIDYFYTCWENIGYLIPVEECSTSKSIRLQKIGTIYQNSTYAEDCTIEKTLERCEFN